MKNFVIAGLMTLVLATTAVGCRPQMAGMMRGGMMQGMSAHSGEKSDSSGGGMMMGDMAGKGMMSCYNEQCPMMKGKGGAT